MRVYSCILEYWFVQYGYICSYNYQGTFNDQIRFDYKQKYVLHFDVDAPIIMEKMGQGDPKIT